VTTAKYDTLGRLVQFVDPMQPTEKDAKPAAVKYAYDAGLLVETSTDRIGVVTTKNFDAAGRLQSVASSLGATATYEYDLAGNVVKEISNRGDGAPDLTTVREYDALGRLRKEQVGSRTTFTDYFDDRTSLPGEWTVATTDALGYVTATRLDALGNPLAIVAPRGTGLPNPAGGYQSGKESRVQVFSYGWNPVADTVTVTTLDSVGQAAIPWSVPAANAGYALALTTSEVRSVSGAVLETRQSGWTVTDQGDQVVERTVATTTYDTLGRPLTVTLGEANSEAAEVRSFEYDDTLTGTGQVTVEGRSLSHDVISRYDSAGNRTSVSVGPVANVKRTAYDGLSRVTEDHADGGLLGALSRFLRGAMEYLGVARTQTSPAGGTTTTKLDVAARTYEISGNNGGTSFTSKQTADGSLSIDGRLRMKQTVDAYGDVRTITDGNELVTFRDYDDLGRLVEERGPAGKVNRKYDAAGNVTVLIDANRHTTRYTYDPHGRVLSVTDALGNSTLYTYDAFGNRLSLTDPNGNTTQWQYDDRDRVIRETDTLGAIATYDYDAIGRVVRHQRKDFSLIETKYDKDTRTQTEFWGGEANPTKTLVYSFDVTGNLISAQDGEVAFTRGYENGLLRSESTRIAPVAFAQFAYGYTDGDLASVEARLGERPATAPADVRLAFGYCGDGQIKSIERTRADGGRIGVAYEYDDGGRRTTLTRSTGSGSTPTAFATVYGYQENTGRLASIHHKVPAPLIARYDFTWKPGGQLETFTSATEGKTTFTYDATNQLTGIDYQNARFADQSFGYDDNGNRNTAGNEPGADNRLAADANWTFQYDKNGNLVTRTHKTDGRVIKYEYDLRNRLTSVTVADAGTAQETSQTLRQVTYAYDALDRRISRLVDGDGNGTFETTEYFVHRGLRSDRGNAGDELMFVLDATGGVVAGIFHGAGVDEVVAEEWAGTDGTTDVRWLLADHQGSVRDVLVADASGQLKQAGHVVYDAFGNVLETQADGVRTIHGYTGREYDPVAELQYNRARYYDPSLGRWISQDPISFAAGDANLYRYVGNGPLDGTDPSGLKERMLKGVDFNKKLFGLEPRTIGSSRMGHHKIPFNVCKDLLEFLDDVYLDQINNFRIDSADGQHDRLGHAAYDKAVRELVEHEKKRFLDEEGLSSLQNLDPKQQEKLTKRLMNAVDHQPAYTEIGAFNTAVANSGRNGLSRLGNVKNSLPTQGQGLDKFDPNWDVRYRLNKIFEGVEQSGRFFGLGPAGFAALGTTKASAGPIERAGKAIADRNVTELRRSLVGTHPGSLIGVLQDELKDNSLWYRGEPLVRNGLDQLIADCQSEWDRQPRRQVRENPPTELVIAEVGVAEGPGEQQGSAPIVPLASSAQRGDKWEYLWHAVQTLSAYWYYLR
jgi:RHS repeat-associated protein